MIGVKRIFQSKEEMQVPATKLSFKIEKEFPDQVMLKNDKNNSIIGRKGNQMLYSINCENLGPKDEAEMERVKTIAVNSMLGNKTTEYSKENMNLLKGIIASILRTYPNQENTALMSYLVANDVLGFGPISILLEDAENIEEIVINSPTGRIGIYHTAYGYCNTNLRFKSEADFRFIINKLIGITERELNDSSPIIDAEIYSGTRVHAQISPYAVSGAAASIRIGGKKSMNIKRLAELKTASFEVLAYLWMAIDTKCNILISGAPSSGKTTMLTALNIFLPKTERIVTIEEDANEIKYFGNFINVVQLQSSQKGPVALIDQVINALHLRPDRLVLGEIRGNEAAEVFAGSNLGIPFMATIHSSGNGEYVLSRLRSKPMLVDESLISMLDISIFMKQVSIDTRVIESIDEYRWLSRNEIKPIGTNPYLINEIARSGILANDLGKSKVIEKFAELHMVKISTAIKEFRNRVTFLEEMYNGNEEPYSYIEKYGVR
ncbi:MAG: ATPase, T2SS/T4P/T4SS family [Candidatus Micrarchaeia archaeon]